VPHASVAMTSLVSHALGFDKSRSGQMDFQLPDNLRSYQHNAFVLRCLRWDGGFNSLLIKHC
jgi:hypothetical protein